ncbi:MAG: hypothetical protein OXG13_22665 [Gemmatimonadaceae bacterium]|nr:hypothetical protein [Gemmatimonadaceae bacterium]
MIKLLLFGLLCGLGYRLIRSIGRSGADDGERARAPLDRRRVVEAEFEDAADRSSKEGGP